MTDHPLDAIVNGTWDGQVVTWATSSWDAMHAESTRRMNTLRWWEVLLGGSHVPTGEFRYHAMAWELRKRWHREYDPSIELEHSAPLYGDEFHIRTGRTRA